MRHRRYQVLGTGRSPRLRHKDYVLLRPSGVTVSSDYEYGTVPWPSDYSYRDRDYRSWPLRFTSTVRVSLPYSYSYIISTSVYGAV